MTEPMHEANQEEQQMDVVDGKATRDIAAGETIHMSLHEVLRLPEKAEALQTQLAAAQKEREEAQRMRDNWERIAKEEAIENEKLSAKVAAMVEVLEHVKRTGTWRWQGVSDDKQLQWNAEHAAECLANLPTLSAGIFKVAEAAKEFIEAERAAKIMTDDTKPEYWKCYNALDTTKDNLKAAVDALPGEGGRS